MDQEEFLRLVQKETWTPILSFLHKRKEDIKEDSMLQFATTIFESEFFNKLKGGSHKISVEHLESLYQLHKGKFFFIKDESYLELARSLATRTIGDQAYNYANLFPNDPICKAIIENTKEEFKPINTSTLNKIKKADWIEIYNRLFEAINNPGDQSTYFSGPRFINTLQDFNRYHPDYTQYIELRNFQGKSTSRRIYYYDILMEQTETVRLRFVNKILTMLEPFDLLRIQPIRILLNGGAVTHPIAGADDIVKKVFISYSWDDESHKQWVLKLAEKLLAEGIEVILDRYELKPGKSLPYFVENAIKKADRIIMVFTPNYKLKAENREGGVGFEYSIMNAMLYADQSNEKIIPVIRSGSQQQSVPSFLQQYIHLDMTKDENFNNSFADLLRELKDNPEFIKPELGIK